MDGNPKETIMQDEGVQELLQILRIFQKGKEAGEVFELAAYIDGLGSKLEQVMGELATVKSQLNEIKELNERRSLKEMITDAVEKLEESCMLMKVKLLEVKTEVKEKAKEIVQAVKEKGLLGLNKLSKLPGVRDILSNMKNNLKKNISYVDSVMERIDNAGLHLRKTATDLGNVGRALAGKEMADIKGKSGFSLSDIIKAPWKLNRKCLSSMLNRVDAAIEKVDSLSQKIESMEREKDKDKSPVSYEEERERFIKDHVAEGGSYVSNSEVFEDFQKSYEGKMGERKKLEDSVNKPKKSR